MALARQACGVTDHTIPAGSDTRGAAAYDESYADTRRWVEQGLLDYIAPQNYWPFSRSAARYDVLAIWLVDVVNRPGPACISVSPSIKWVNLQR
ncbi:family 10 glycosylhydrolase [Escherichia coli]